MVEEYISKLRPIVEGMFSGESSGHDIGHLERVMKTALYIQSKEGGNKVVVGVSAFLHDIHRLEQNKTGKYCSPKESLPIIEGLLKQVDFPEELTWMVLNAIEHHEVYNWNAEDVKTKEIEALILQDADNVDGTGAMGIARTFAYAGANNILFFNDDISIDDICKDGYKEETGGKETTIHHFYHKLLKLGDNMNTKTAKELTKKRTEFMESFINEFLKEWKCEY